VRGRYGGDASKINKDTAGPGRGSVWPAVPGRGEVGARCDPTGKPPEGKAFLFYLGAGVRFGPRERGPRTLFFIPYVLSYSRDYPRGWLAIELRVMNGFQLVCCLGRHCR
jgi:hypothetical protein